MTMAKTRDVNFSKKGNLVILPWTRTGYGMRETLLSFVTFHSMYYFNIFKYIMTDSVAVFSVKL